MLPFSSPGRPLRILQLSDLHIEHITIHEKQIMEAVDRLAPDMIVMTGDYINKSFVDDPTALLEARQVAFPTTCSQWSLRRQWELGFA